MSSTAHLDTSLLLIGCCLRHRGGNSANHTQVHEEHSHSELQHNQDLSAYDKPAYYQKHPVNVIEGMETHDH